MRTPYKLIEAFEVLRQRQVKPPNVNGTFQSDAVDILGIVSNISTSCRPITPASSISERSLRRRHIWLLDESLDDAPKSSIGPSFGFLFVIHKSSQIVRTFEEKIKVGDIIRFNSVVLRSFGGSSYLQFSSQVSEPGLRWFRLGCVDCHGRFLVEISNSHRNAVIPEGTITSNERVKELANWYKNRTNIDQYPPSTPNTLPTQKRRLDEIQSAAGFLSNVSVYVMHASSENNSGINATKRNDRTGSSVAFASVTDDSGAAMSFIDLSGRFLPILTLAKRKSDTMRLMMTNVLTEHQNNFDGWGNFTKDDIILVPTNATTGRLTPKESGSNYPARESISSCDHIATQRQEMTETVEKRIVSSIKDIQINGLSLKTSPSIFSSPPKFLKTITGKDGNFNTAVVLFKDSDEQYIETVPNVLENLCGSLNISELSNQELCMYSMEFLHGLLRKPILLNWTLRKKPMNNYVIIEAALHHV